MGMAAAIPSSIPYPVVPIASPAPLWGEAERYFTANESQYFRSVA